MDALGEGVLQVVDHLDHAVLGIGREVLFDIEFAEGFAHGTVDGTGDAFPAGTQLLSAAEGAAIEVEVGVDKVAAEVSGGGVDDVPGIVGLDGIEALRLVEELAHLAEILRLAHVEACELGQPDFGKVVFQVETGCTDGSGVEVHLIVSLEGVAVLLVAVLGLGQTGFEVHDHLGQLRGGLAAQLVVAGVGKLGFHQGNISLAKFGFAAFAFEVVVALAHADTALVEPGDALVGILGVGLVEEGEEGIDADAVQAAHLGLELVDALEGGDFIQVGHNGLGTLFLDGGGVHADGVEGGNLVAIAAGLVLGVDQRVDQGAQLLLVGLGQHVESAIAAVLSVERVSLQPASAGIVIEILGGVDRRVQIVKVDTGAQLGALVTSRNGKERKCHDC